MRNVIKSLDKIAEDLEAKGRVDLALKIDKKKLLKK